MRGRLRKFLRSYIVSNLYEELQDRKSIDYQDDNQRSDFSPIDSISQPEKNYLSSGYEQMFQSNQQYQIANEFSDETDFHSNISEISQGTNEFLNQEILPEESLSAEQEIKDAIKETVETIHDVSSHAMEESNFITEQSLEAELLDYMIDEPMPEDDMMEPFQPMM